MSLVYLCVVKSQEEAGSVHGPVSILNKIAIETVCKIGHSYIHRLREFVNKVSSEFGLGYGFLTVDFRSRGGLKFESLAHCPAFLRFNTLRDICLIQLGGHDLSQNNPNKVCTDIFFDCTIFTFWYGYWDCYCRSVNAYSAVGIPPRLQRECSEIERVVKKEMDKFEGAHF